MMNLDSLVDRSKPVFVSGATGYLAGVTVAKLLDLGVTVHATVRNPSNKEKELKPLRDIERKAPGKLVIFEADLMDEGSFDDAMKNCHIVFHMTSPVIFASDDPENQVVKPAIEGTRNVLESANRTPSVKRVVLTSSIAAIYSDASETYKNPGNRSTEQVWNKTATMDYQPYFLSKVKQEEKAWEIAKAQSQWTLVVMNPGFVQGPGIRYHPTSESHIMLINIGGGKMQYGAPNFAMPVVDVRDVAVGHIRAAFDPKATGRHILVGTNTDIMTMAATLRQKYPDYPIPTYKVNKTLLWLIAPLLGLDGLTRRGVKENVDIKINFDASKSRRELGMKYRPLEESLCDMFQQLIDEGAVKKKENLVSSWLLTMFVLGTIATTALWHKDLLAADTQSSAPGLIF